MEKIVERYRITGGKHFRLADFDPDDTAGLAPEKGEAKELLAEGVGLLAEAQDRLFAQDRWSVLAVFQAMDAAGKDGTIKHVFSGVNPQGCQVHAFKQPSAEDLDHDWLWRHWKALPERGRIGIHNRSHYEEVLVTRVHPGVLDNQKLPPSLRGKRLIGERLADIAGFEHYLARNGIVVLKFFLHVSKKEQKKRFLERIDQPAKNWKFAVADVAERAKWDAYQDAYQDAIAATAAEHAPWFVVPADNKWFTRLVVVGALVLALDGLELGYPKLAADAAARLAEARAALLGEE
ncbi:MAG: polyphosphate kinase 2 family protein [Acetobacteraceae bacterium]|nr:polyphosphate kinase 2 family protein [Acetobacteraceae bacterium]